MLLHYTFIQLLSIICDMARIYYTNPWPWEIGQCILAEIRTESHTGQSWGIVKKVTDKKTEEKKPPDKKSRRKNSQNTVHQILNEVELSNYWSVCDVQPSTMTNSGKDMYMNGKLHDDVQITTLYLKINIYDLNPDIKWRIKMAIKCL